MRHRYECPTRWADLDLLGHVNNVVYVDYLQEARVDMLRAHAPAAPADADGLVEGIVVARHEVSYRAPLHVGFRPVSIECWVTEIRAASFTMAYEVFHDGEDGGDDGGRRTYLRATTRLAPYVFGAERPRRLTAEERLTLGAYLEPPEEKAARPAPVRVTRTEVGHFDVHVRFSDVDVYGHVNNVKYFEYLQEARIRWHSEVTRGLDVPEFRMVVAQTDVDYLQPILFRPEPYDCWTQVTRVGDRSMTMESEIVDGERVLARARIGMVFFDTETQRATAPPEAYKQRLVELLA